MELRLDDKQADALKTVLDNAISDMSPEIADTDNPEYRAELKERRDTLRAIAAQLSP